MKIREQFQWELFSNEKQTAHTATTLYGAYQRFMMSFRKFDEITFCTVKTSECFSVLAKQTKSFWDAMQSNLIIIYFNKIWYSNYIQVYSEAHLCIHTQMPGTFKTSLCEFTIPQIKNFYHFKCNMCIRMVWRTFREFTRI